MGKHIHAKRVLNPEQQARVLGAISHLQKLEKKSSSKYLRNLPRTEIRRLCLLMLNQNYLLDWFELDKKRENYLKKGPLPYQHYESALQFGQKWKVNFELGMTLNGGLPLPDADSFTPVVGIPVWRCPKCHHPEQIEAAQYSCSCGDTQNLHFGFLCSNCGAGTLRQIKNECPECGTALIKSWNHMIPITQDLTLAKLKANWKIYEGFRNQITNGQEPLAIDWSSWRRRYKWAVDHQLKRRSYGQITKADIKAHPLGDSDFEARRQLIKSTIQNILKNSANL